MFGTRTLALAEPELALEGWGRRARRGVLGAAWAAGGGGTGVRPAMASSMLMSGSSSLGSVAGRSRVGAKST